MTTGFLFFYKYFPIANKWQRWQNLPEDMGSINMGLVEDRRKEGSVLFNDTLNTFSYGYMASDIW